MRILLGRDPGLEGVSTAIGINYNQIETVFPQLS